MMFSFAVKELGLPETPDVMYGTFVSRVRDKLHIVLCMSPVGDSFRIRCRMFPSLINCCTIDWCVWKRVSLFIRFVMSFVECYQFNDDTVSHFMRPHEDSTKVLLLAHDVGQRFVQDSVSHVSIVDQLLHNRLVRMEESACLFVFILFVGC